MAAAYVHSFVMRTVGECVIWLSGPNCKKQYKLRYFTHDNKRRKKIERICDRIESGCAKRVGNNKNLFGVNAAVQVFIYSTALVRGVLNISHRKSV